MKLSVVMPVYNERQFIEEILNRVLAVNIDGVNIEIIIIDDCSTDGTREFLKAIVDMQASPDIKGNDKIGNAIVNNRHKIKIVFQDKNRGKGAALRRGFGEISGDVVIIQDADLEYDPSDYPKLLDPLLRGVADVVYGSRFLGGPHRVLYFWHYIGNRFLTLFSNMLTNLNLTDMESCYKAFRLDILREFDIEQNRFGFEPEITAKVARNKYRIYEVPISYYGRTYAEGKKVGWKDGLKAIYYIIRYNIF